ncbi:MAG: UDP-N-acetylmuramoyl-L-alanine--D-glutamate ligase [Alphaproteobacteria bacterium]|nr:UDP-N-acetylmuramoyl-L-alanine--D-glutamate ligase [Alphaproteobacteria bacterium]
MITPSPFKDQKIFVLGLGRSGRSVSQSLLKAGAHVLAWDDQDEARKVATEQGISLANLNVLEWKDIDHLVLSPGIPHRYPAPHPLVTEALRVGLQPISDLEILYHTQPLARYIGITGSNGKSTTTAIIGHILKNSGKRVEVGGNIGIPAMDLNPLGKDDTYVLELSSYQLEISPTLHCNINILLNITPDHLDRHGGMDGYIEAKKLIYKNATSHDILVINVDDEHCLKIYEALRASDKTRLLPISVNTILSEGIYVNDGILYENASPVLDLKQFERLKGEHNWQNIAASYGALRSMGLESGAISEGISSFPGLAHRQQVVAHHKNVLFVNDSKATNAEAVAKVLATYQGVPLYWLLGGRPKEGGISALMPYFSSIKHAFLFGEATPMFASTLDGEVSYTLCNTVKEAVKKASSLAFNDQAERVIVLLAPACASFDQFTDFEARGEAFCEAVREVIGEKGD